MDQDPSDGTESKIKTACASLGGAVSGAGKKRYTTPAPPATAQAQTPVSVLPEKRGTMSDVYIQRVRTSRRKRRII